MRHLRHVPRHRPAQRRRELREPLRVREPARTSRRGTPAPLLRARAPDVHEPSCRRGSPWQSPSRWLLGERRAYSSGPLGERASHRLLELGLRLVVGGQGRKVAGRQVEVAVDHHRAPRASARDGSPRAPRFRSPSTRRRRKTSLFDLHPLRAERVGHARHEREVGRVAPVDLPARGARLFRAVAVRAVVGADERRAVCCARVLGAGRQYMLPPTVIRTSCGLRARIRPQVEPETHQRRRLQGWRRPSPRRKGQRPRRARRKGARSDGFDAGRNCSSRINWRPVWRRVGGPLGAGSTLGS